MIRYFLTFFASQRFPIPPSCSSDMKMNAIIMKTHGEIDVLSYEKDVPCPIIPNNNNEMIEIDIAAAGINPVDAKMRKCQISNLVYPIDKKFGKIIGSDISGIVTKLPNDGNDIEFQIGDRVFAFLPLLNSPYGGYAEKCCLSYKNIYKLPKNVSLLDAATIPLVACTFHQAIQPLIHKYGNESNIINLNNNYINNNNSNNSNSCNNNSSSSQKRQLYALVQGGAGGLGSYCIQYLSKVLKFHVTTTASSKNKQLLIDLGASTVVDYHSEDFESFTPPHGYDIVIDPFGYMYEERTLRCYNNNNGNSTSTSTSTSRKTLMADGGIYVRVASSPFESSSSMSGDPFGLTIPEARPDRVLSGWLQQSWRNFINKIQASSSSSSIDGSNYQYHFVLVHPEQEALRKAASAIEERLVQAVIQKEFPLKEAKEAHKLLEQGHCCGKLVLRVNERLLHDDEKMIQCKK